MHHTVALFASLTSLGLICAIYFCNIMSRPESRLRSETLAMILLSLLTGLFPLAIAASLVGLWAVVADGLTLPDLIAAGADIVAIVASLVAAYVFRATVKATYRTRVRLKPDLASVPHMRAAA